VSAFAKGFVEEPLRASRLTVDAVRARRGAVRAESSVLNPSLVERLEAVRDYLHRHLAEPVSLADLGAVAALSPSYLVRAFKSYVGVPPHRYLVCIRLERAQELLLSSSLSITQIAHRVGFASASHFITRFQTAFGTTPFRFRRQAQLGGPAAVPAILPV
jgi:transcriptional regulator GlxA family with amidase domain